MSDDNKSFTLENAVSNPQSFSLIPLMELIKDNTDIDISNDLLSKGIDISKKLGEHGNIQITNPSGEITKIFVDIVDSNYNIMDSFNESKYCNLHIESFEELSKISDELKEKTIDMISYLCQCCLIVFNNLKDDIIELVEYQLTMDTNTKIFILNSKKNINEMKYLSIRFD